MSHLQPKFIAKAKEGLKRSQEPRSMPRSMIVTESTSIPTARHKRRPGEFGWCWWNSGSVDYRIFSLKK